MTNLLTLSEIRTYLKIDDPENKYDEILDFLNDNTTELIQQWLGRDIIQTQYTEEFDIEYDQNTVELAHYPVTSVAGVTDDGVGLTEDTDFEVYESGFIKVIKLDASLTNRTLYRKVGDFTPGLKKVQVTYTAGYSPVPGAIKLAALKLIWKEFYLRGDSDNKSFNDGSMSFTRMDYKDGMPPDVYTQLQSYIRRVV